MFEVILQLILGYVLFVWLLERLKVSMNYQYNSLWMAIYIGMWAIVIAVALYLLAIFL